MKPNNKFAIDALFLGPKAENGHFLAKTIEEFSFMMVVLVKSLITL